MTVRAKTKKRLLFLAVVGLLCATTLVTVYVVKKRNRVQRNMQYIQDGLQAYQRNDYSATLDLLGHVETQYYQTNPEILHALADANFFIEDPDRVHLMPAKELYQRYLNYKPDDRAAQEHLLSTYMKIRFFPEALAMAKQILTKDPNNLPALQARASSLHLMHQLKEALESAQVLNKIYPQDITGQDLTIRIMMDANYPKEDLRARGRQLMQAYPQDPKFEMLMSQICYYTDDIEGMVKYAQEAGRRKITDPKVLGEVVTKLDLAQRYSDATAVLERNAAHTSDAKFLRFWMLRLCTLGRYQDVDTQLQQLNPGDNISDPELLALRAYCLIKLNRNDQAQKIVETLQTRGSEVRAAVLWAKVLHNQLDETANRKEALRDVRMACAAWPLHPLLLELQGNLLEQMGYINAAETKYREASGAAPVWVDPLLALSRLYASQNNLPFAFEFAVKALQSNPNDRAAKINKVVLWMGVLDQGFSVDKKGLRPAVDELLASNPRDEELFPVEVRLLCVEEKVPEATKRLTQILASGTPWKEATYYRLFRVSYDQKLGLDEAILNALDKAYPDSATAVYLRTSWLVSKKQNDAARNLFQAAYAKHKGQHDWEINHAKLLELLADSGALEKWDQLGKTYPEDLQVINQMLVSKVVGENHLLYGAVLDRMAQQMGADDNQYRYLRARWLLADQNRASNISEAVRLLTELVRGQPNHLAGRYLLAELFETQKNYSGAVEQYTAIADSQPILPMPALQGARVALLSGDAGRALSLVNRAVGLKFRSNEEIALAASILGQLHEIDRAVLLLKDIPEAQRDNGQRLSLAALYRQQNQLALAQKLCEQNMAKPDLATVQFYTDLLASQGKVDEARKVLARVAELSLQPGQKELLNADFQLAYGSADEALSLYRAATKAAPKNSLVWSQLINALIRTGKSPEAVTVLHQAVTELPDNSQFKTLETYSALIADLGGNPYTRDLVLTLVQSPLEKMYPLAETLKIWQTAKNNNTPIQQVLPSLRGIADRNPRVLSIQLFMGQLYLLTNNNEEAIAITGRASQGFPTLSEPARQYATALFSAQHWDDALLAAQEWRNRSLNDPSGADFMIASIYIRRGQPANALTQLEPHLAVAHQDIEKNAPVVIAEVEALLTLHRYAQVKALLTPVLNTSADWRARWIHYCFQNVADTTVAASWLEQVTPLIPNSAIEEQVELAKAWYLLGRSSKKTEYVTRGLQRIEQLSQSATANANVWFIKGSMLEQQEKYPEAEQAYRKALALDPKSHVVQNNLASLLLNIPNGDLPAALELANHVIEAESSVAAYYDTRAAIYSRLKKYDEAIADWKKAGSLEPGNIDWSLSLIEVQVQAQQLNAARISWTQSNLDNIDTKKLKPAQRARLTKIAQQLANK